MSSDHLRCFCDDCGPIGSLQSKATLSVHSKRQRAKVHAVQNRVSLIKDLMNVRDHDHRQPAIPTLVDSSCSRRSQQGPSGDSSCQSVATELGHIQEELTRRLSRFKLPDVLTFQYPPLTQTAMYPGPGDVPNVAWDEGPAALVPTIPSNASILLHVSYLRSTKAALARMQSANLRPLELTPSLESAIKAVTLGLQDLETWRMVQWISHQRSTPDPEGLGPWRYMTGRSRSTDVNERPMTSFHTSEPFYRGMKGDDPIINTCIFLILVLNLLHHVTIPACRFTMKILKRLIQVTMTRNLPDTDTESQTKLQQLVGEMPADVSTSKKHLNIMPDTIDYSCCPSRFALYPVSHLSTTPPVNNTHHSFIEGQRICDYLPFYSEDESPDSRRAEDTRSAHIEFCTYRDPEEEGECGTRVLRQRTQHGCSTPQYRPILKYSHQTLVSWIARMMSRPDFEVMVDSSLLDRLDQQHTASGDHIDDILQAPEVRSFLDHDGRPFLEGHGDECHLLFSLFIDWFNPRGNRRAGQSISSGVIFMACLNLPLEVRYKRENIYLAGVLPGPKAPSLQQVNHFLRLIVHELGPLWKDGVHLSRTASRYSGRVVRCALIPLVSDLGAVRKTSGTASHSATYFCTFCQLKKRNINDVDDHSWPRRDCAEFRRHAEEWQRAATLKERDKIFKAHGVRYSVLLELPYWKPTRYILLDTMHNMFLGLFQRHCRKVFGMKIDAPESERDEEEVTPTVFTEEDVVMARSKLQRCQTAESLRDSLKVPMMRMLYEMSGFGRPGKKTKLEMAKEMLAQVSSSRLCCIDKLVNTCE